MVYSRVPSSWIRSSLLGMVMLCATDFFPLWKNVSGVQILLAIRLFKRRIFIGPSNFSRSSFQLCLKKTSMVYSCKKMKQQHILDTFWDSVGCFLSLMVYLVWCFVCDNWAHNTLLLTGDEFAVVFTIVTIQSIGQPWFVFPLQAKPMNTIQIQAFSYPLMICGVTFPIHLFLLWWINTVCQLICKWSLLHLRLKLCRGESITQTFN